MVHDAKLTCPQSYDEMSELARICLAISVFWDGGVKIKVKGLTVSNEDCHLLSVWCGAHGIYCCLTNFQCFDFAGHNSPALFYFHF